MDATTHYKLLGGTIQTTLYDVDKVFASQCNQEIQDECLRLQKIFNFFDPNSELSKLNAKRQLAVSKDLLFVIKRALEFCEQTKGAYDISKGKQFLARKQGKEIPFVSCSFEDIKISGREITLSHPDALLDLGSIAKGYIGDKLIEFTQSLGVESAFIDARGDMRIYGKHIEVATIQHPRKEEKILPFVLENMACATSGDYRQFHGSPETSHIVGKTDLCSVTVIADDLITADGAASAIFLLGRHMAEQFISLNKGLRCVLIDKSGGIYTYNGFDTIKVDNKR